MHYSNATSHLTPGSALLLTRAPPPAQLEDSEGGPPPAQLEEGEGGPPPAELEEGGGGPPPAELEEAGGGPPPAELEEGGGGARRFSYSDLVLEQWRPAPARHD